MIIFLNTYGSYYTNIFGYSPFLFGTIVAGVKVKLIGAVQLTRTVLNALVDSVKVPEYQLSKENKKRLVDLKLNVSVMKDLIAIGEMFKKGSMTAEKDIIEKMNQLLPSLKNLLKCDRSLRKQLDVLFETITATNFDLVLLKMFYYACDYNRVTCVRFASKQEQLKYFVTTGLPQALAQVYQKIEWYHSVFGIDAIADNLNVDNLTFLNQKMLVVTNLHDQVLTNPPPNKFFNFATANSMKKLESLNKVAEEATRVALQGLTELYMNACAKENNSSVEQPEISFSPQLVQWEQEKHDDENDEEMPVDEPKVNK